MNVFPVLLVQVLLPVTLAGQQQQQETVPMIFDTGTSSPYTWGFDRHLNSNNNNRSNSSATSTDATTILSGLDIGATAMGTITGSSSSSSSEASTYYYQTGPTTIGSITSQDFMFLVPKDMDSDAKLLSKGGLYGFAPGGYAVPGAPAEAPVADVLSTWKQLSAAAGLSGMTDRFGLWLSNDQRLLEAPSAFAGEVSVGQLNPDRYTGTGVWVPVEPADAGVRTDVKHGQLVSVCGGGASVHRLATLCMFSHSMLAR